MVVLLWGCLVFFFLFVVVWFFSSGVLNYIDLVGSCWSSSYECGFGSSSISLNCFSFTYFSLLVLFVIFDLEISLLLNMPEQGLLFSNFVYYYFFIVVLVISFLVELFVGYVRWSY